MPTCDKEDIATPLCAGVDGSEFAACGRDVVVVRPGAACSRDGLVVRLGVEVEVVWAETACLEAEATVSVSTRDWASRT
jgi:hypothetical protein